NPAEKPLAERVKPLEQEQRAIAEAAKNLSIPPQNKEAEKARQTAAEKANEAAEALKKQDTAQADKKIEEARQALQRLAYALPGQKTPDQKAQDLADKQQELAKKAEQQANDPKATPEQQQQLAKQQQDLAREARNLEAPEAPQRKAEAEKATQQA